MAKELKMVNPHFQTDYFMNGSKMHRLVFDGWDGIGNIDEDGDEFWYEVTAEPEAWNRADAYAYGYSWFFDKVYEDDSIKADFSNTEIEIVIREMMEMIRQEGIE